MTESVEPQAPEEEAALRELEIKHRRRRRWVALFSSVIVSVHMTVILHTIWDGWPLRECSLGPLALLVVNALGGLGWLGWSLRCFRRDEAMARQWTLQNARWQAQDRAWRDQWVERRGQSRAGEAR